MFERRFGAFALGFESGGAFARNIVKFDDAVFNQAIEAFQTFIRINSFTLERQEVGGRQPRSSQIAARQGIEVSRQSTVIKGGKWQAIFLVE